jgi:hypothetical protein
MPQIAADCSSLTSRRQARALEPARLLRHPVLGEQN